jgi:hypothetical protein
MRQQPCSESQEGMGAEAEAEAKTDGGGDEGGPPPAPEGVVLPSDFGLTPAQVAPARYIRYSEATGIKL